MRMMTATVGETGLRFGWPPMVKLALFCCAYAVTAATSIGLGQDNMPVFWPPSGIYVGALMLVPTRLWPAYIAAVGCAELSIDLVVYQFSFVASAALALANGLDALGAAYLVRRRHPQPLRFDTLHQHAALVMLAFALGPAVGACLGAATLSAVTGGKFGSHWWSWWIDDFLGMLVFAPLTLLAVGPWRKQLKQVRAQRWIEFGALALVSGALFHVVFSRSLPIPYAALLPLLWAALRFGLPGVVVFVAVLSLLASRYTVLGYGPFAYAGGNAQLSTWMVELFVGLVGIPTLLVAALMKQREAAQVALVRAEALARTELEQRVAERTAALQASELRYRTLVSATNQSIWILDAEGKLSAASKSNIGKDSTRFAGGGWQDSIHPDDLAGLLAEEREAFLASRSRTSLWEHEHRIRNQNGERRYVVWRAAPVLEEDGTVREWIGTTTDITEHKLAEQALSASERRYRSLVMAANQSISTVDASGNLSTVTKSTSGKPEAELKGQEWLRTVHPDDLANLDETWEAFKAAGTSASLYEHECRIHDAKGEWRNVAIRAAAVVEDDGSVHEWIGTTTDVTEHKQAEAALRVSEERYRTLLNASQQSVWVMDPHGNIIALHNSVQKRDVAQQSGKQWLQWVHPEEREQIWLSFEAALREAKTLQMEQRLLAANGNVLNVQALGVPVLNRDGSLREMIGTTVDVTERKKAEQALRETAASLRRLAAHQEEVLEAERVRIAHDLHDGVGQLLNVAKLKVATTVNSAEPRAQLEEIAQIIDQANSAIRTLEFELSPPVLRELGLVPALTWLADEMRRQYSLKVTVSDDHEPKPLDQLRRAVVFRAARELLINVARHSGKCGAEVMTRQVEDDLELTVSDAGVGFDMSVNQGAEACGLGLIGVRERIAAIGGSSEFHSQTGAGTVVTLRVPLFAAAGLRRSLA